MPIAGFLVVDFSVLGVIRQREGLPAFFAIISESVRRVITLVKLFGRLFCLAKNTDFRFHYAIRMIAEVALAVGKTMTNDPFEDDLSEPKAKVTTEALDEFAL